MRYAPLDSYPLPTRHGPRIKPADAPFPEADRGLHLRTLRRVQRRRRIHQPLRRLPLQQACRCRAGRPGHHLLRHDAPNVGAHEQGPVEVDPRVRALRLRADELRPARGDRRRHPVHAGASKKTSLTVAVNGARRDGIRQNRIRTPASTRLPASGASSLTKEVCWRCSSSPRLRPATNRIRSAPPR